MPELSIRSPAALASWLRLFLPARTAVDSRERLRAAIGALVGIAVAGLACHALHDRWGVAEVWMFAPLGASAVLAFAVPASPLAQPWAVVAGNTVSALVGVACVQLFGRGDVSAGVAVGAAVGLMFALRCLHPPGGATALLVCLLGVSDPRFALFPVLADSAALVAVAMVYNTLTGRSYPHRPLPPRTVADVGLDADLESLLARHNQVLDIDREDLRALAEDLRLRIHARRLDALRCADVMGSDPVAVYPDTLVAQAAPLFDTRGIKALPVIDAARRVVGILTPADLRRKPAAGAPGATVDGVMSAAAQCAETSSHLGDILPLFAGTGHHHLPVIDGDGCLVGMLTESDVVRALARVAGA